MYLLKFYFIKYIYFKHLLIIFFIINLINEFVIFIMSNICARCITKTIELTSNKNTSNYEI